MKKVILSKEEIEDIKQWLIKDIRLLEIIVSSSIYKIDDNDGFISSQTKKFMKDELKECKRMLKIKKSIYNKIIGKVRKNAKRTIHRLKTRDDK